MNPGGWPIRNCVAILAVAIAAVLLSAAGAYGAPTWLASAKLSAAGASAEKPQVAVDAAGDSLAVWERPDTETGKEVIEAASRPAGAGSWRASQPITSTSLQSTEPQVALGGAGEGVAVWLTLDKGEYSYVVASRPNAVSSWAAPVTLKVIGPMTTMESRPDVAMDPAGDAVVVWQRPSGGKTIVESAYRAGPAGTWGSPETIAEDGDGMHPAEVGIDSTGAATAVWESSEGTIRTAVDERPAGGKWGSEVLLSKEVGNANEPRVAVGANGAAVAIWERFDCEAGEEIVEAASRATAKGAWGKAVALTRTEGCKGEPAAQQVAIDGNGHAVVTWSRSDAANHDVVEAAVGNAATSAWGAPKALSSPAGNFEESPAVAVSDAGTAVVVWEQWTLTRKVVEAASGSAVTGGWAPAVALSAEGEEADEQQVAMDGQGDAAAVWRRSDGSFFRAEAAGFDAAGPRLDARTIPSGGNVGQPVTYTVSPFDVWSAIGTTSWTFGDGLSASGTTVAHTYAAPGAYTVTLTGADVLGNTSSVAKTVSISAVRPLLSGASATHRRFRVGPHATAIAARKRPPSGTVFRFSLSEQAAIKIVLSRAVPGLRSGKRCVVPGAKLRAHHARHCTRLVGAGTLTRTKVGAGPGAIPFSGRVGRRALHPGSYRASITADSFGLSSPAVTLTFAVVR